MYLLFLEKLLLTPAVTGGRTQPSHPARRLPPSRYTQGMNSNHHSVTQSRRRMSPSRKPHWAAGSASGGRAQTRRRSVARSHAKACRAPLRRSDRLSTLHVTRHSWQHLPLRRLVLIFVNSYKLITNAYCVLYPYQKAFKWWNHDDLRVNDVLSPNLGIIYPSCRGSSLPSNFFIPPTPTLTGGVK